jgi:hypothetical protein
MAAATVGEEMSVAASILETRPALEEEEHWQNVKG